jgi:hypothetical protein
MSLKKVENMGASAVGAIFQAVVFYDLHFGTKVLFYSAA